MIYSDLNGEAGRTDLCFWFFFPPYSLAIVSSFFALVRRRGVKYMSQKQRHPFKKLELIARAAVIRYYANAGN